MVILQRHSRSNPLHIPRIVVRMKFMLFNVRVILLGSHPQSYVPDGAAKINMSIREIRLFIDCELSCSSICSKSDNTNGYLRI